MMEKLSAKEFDRNLQDVLSKLDEALEKIGKKKEDIILLAATKTVDSETINYCLSKGIKYIGENKVQELLSKDEEVMPCHRHFIGHLQTNKVKDIINRVEMIHSVDSLKLAREISKQAVKNEKIMDILLEVNVAGEESKWGFAPEETENVLKEICGLPNLRVKGLMAIPPICNEAEENRKYFKKMKKLFVDIGSKNIDNSSMDILSMGMSDDFHIAVGEGANLIRLGTALFGKRIYKKF